MLFEGTFSTIQLSSVLMAPARHMYVKLREKERECVKAEGITHVFSQKNLQDEIHSPFGGCKLHFDGFVPLHHSNKNLRELLTIYKH